MLLIFFSGLVCAVFYRLSRRYSYFKLFSSITLLLTMGLCMRSFFQADPELQEARELQQREFAASDRFLGFLVAQRHPSQQILFIASPDSSPTEVSERCAHFRQGLGDKAKFLAIDAPGGIGSQYGGLFMGFTGDQIEAMHKKYPQAQTMVLLTRLAPGPYDWMDDSDPARPSLILQDSRPADFADEIRNHLVDFVSTRISSPEHRGDSDADCYQREHLIVDASNIDKLAKSRPELEIPAANE